MSLCNCFWPVWPWKQKVFRWKGEHWGPASLSSINNGATQQGINSPLFGDKWPSLPEQRNHTTPPSYNRQRRRSERANLCHNLSKMDQGSELWEWCCKWREAVKKASPQWGLAAAAEARDSLGLGFSAYMSCSLLFTVWIIPLIWRGPRAWEWPQLKSHQLALAVEIQTLV